MSILPGSGPGGRRMRPLRLARLAPALIALLMASACVVADGGYGYGPDVGVTYVGGYYEPYGYEYGGWGGGYRVGPSRGGAPRRDSGSRPYRAAPASRHTPSIPSRSRGR